VKGVFLGIKAAIPEMWKAGVGFIINIYASENIRAKSANPGLVDSPMTCARHDNPNIAQERVAEMPLCRMGRPEDIAVGMSALRSRFGGTLTPMGQAGGE
jgi:NAD(P)-dependent dehydrogenase (short-subunit alcohol dehydrogenase family)